MRNLWLAALVLVAALTAGCGSHRAVQVAPPTVRRVLAAKVERCAAGELLPLGNARKSYVGVAPHGAVAYRTPGGDVAARFGAVNVNDYPTIFGVVGAVVEPSCRPAWYRVELPLKPNGSTGFVRASALQLETVDARIEVDVSARTLKLFRKGRLAMKTTVAVGSPSTPTPTGRFYVNQRLIPENRHGPFGPAAIGVSAFSTVLTGWTQGGPIAIHGTNEPWSIGHAVSNGCIRLPNPTLSRLFRVAVAGTPVIIHP